MCCLGSPAFFNANGRKKCEMSNRYLVRIELHDAQWNHYETLHQQMERAGFAHTIKGDSGNFHQLPDATYAAQNTQADMRTVYNTAYSAATKTGRKFGLIVVDYNSARWELPVVTAPRRAA